MNRNFSELINFWKGKKVFVTGHTGFKGSWLVIFLKMLKADIIGYALKPEKNSLFNKARCKKLLKKNIYGDIKNYDSLRQNINRYKPEIIFHLAAQPLVSESYKNPILTFKTNAVGTANLLDIIKKNTKIKSVVIVTTDKVYQSSKEKKIFEENDNLGGKDPYSISKVSAELITRSYIDTILNKKIKNKISTARSGNVIGGGDYSKNRLLPDIIKSINNKKTLTIRNPNNIRPWQHVIEPTFGYIKLAKMLYYFKGYEKNPAWNFGPEKKNFVTVIKIVEYFKKNTKKLKVKVKKTNRFYETKILKLNSNKSKKKLGWKPKWDLIQSLKKVNEWNNLYNKKIDPNKICQDQINDYLGLK